MPDAPNSDGNSHMLKLAAELFALTEVNHCEKISVKPFVGIETDQAGNCDHCLVVGGED